MKRADNLVFVLLCVVALLVACWHGYTRPDTLPGLPRVEDAVLKVRISVEADSAEEAERRARAGNPYREPRWRATKVEPWSPKSTYWCVTLEHP